MLRRYMAGLSRELAMRQLNVASLSELAGGGGPPDRVAALRRWLRSLMLGLTDWDVQRLHSLHPDILEYSEPQLKAWFSALCKQSRRAGLRHRLPELVQSYPRLLVPQRSPGDHLPPALLERRKWYPYSMLEALELHCGGLPAAVHALTSVPELASLNPVVFAELARKLHAVGCSPAEVLQLASTQPALFDHRSILQHSAPLWHKLDYFVRVLGHKPLHVMQKMPLLQREALGEIQKRVAFLEARGDNRHRKHFGWACQSTANFCKELRCPVEEYLEFKASIAAGGAGVVVAGSTGSGVAAGGGGTGGTAGVAKGASQQGSQAGGAAAKASKAPQQQHSQEVGGAAQAAGGAHPRKHHQHGRPMIKAAPTQQRSKAREEAARASKAAHRRQREKLRKSAAGAAPAQQHGNDGKAAAGAKKAAQPGQRGNGGGGATILAPPRQHSKGGNGAVR